MHFKFPQLSASGLMFGSRYPILAAHFEPFKNKKPLSWQMLISYGVLAVKVDLGTDANGKRRVGFVANLHLMAFQVKCPNHAVLAEMISTAGSLAVLAIVSA